MPKKVEHLCLRCGKNFNNLNKHALRKKPCPANILDIDLFT